jgi:hypothetical protein
MKKAIKKVLGEKGPAPVSQEAAVEIVKQVLLKEVSENLSSRIVVGGPGPYALYGLSKKTIDNCLWFSIADEFPGFRVGGSRMIAVSKKTGKIIFDGMVGE